MATKNVAEGRTVKEFQGNHGTSGSSGFLPSRGVRLFSAKGEGSARVGGRKCEQQLGAGERGQKPLCSDISNT